MNIDHRTDVDQSRQERAASAIPLPPAPTVKPELGTADALFAALYHEVRNCPSCKGEGVCVDPARWIASAGRVMGATASPRTRCSRCAESRQVLVAYAKSGGWLPIDSAPQDYTPVDLWGPEVGRWTAARRSERGWKRFSHGRGAVAVNVTMDERYFTHWRPAPPAPAQEPA